VSELRPAALGLLLVLALAAAGCGASSSATLHIYRGAQLERAYLRSPNTPEPDRSYRVNPEYHAHANFVPLGTVEVCPLTQRGDVTPGTPHVVRPVAGQQTGLYVVEPRDPGDHQTPKITQTGFVFPTGGVAQTGMAKVLDGMKKCPASYVVRGGPPQVLGTYDLTTRPVEIDGWTGIAQQLAHSYQADDVFYEDVGHVVVSRSNVILDVLLSHEHVVGDRSDAVGLAEDATRSVIQRLG